MTSPDSPLLADPTRPEQVHTVNVGTTHWYGHGQVVTLVCTCGWWPGYGERYPLADLADAGATHLAEHSDAGVALVTVFCRRPECPVTIDSPDGAAFWCVDHLGDVLDGEVPA